MLKATQETTGLKGQRYKNQMTQVGKNPSKIGLQTTISIITLSINLLIL